MTHPLETAPRGRWHNVNVVAGYLVFGLPALSAVPALLATFAKFGVLPSLANAVPAALAACLPLLLWIRYTRRRPGTYAGKITWFLIGALALLAFAVSPLFFWTGPAALVLVSEILRLIAGPALTFLATGARRAHRKALATRSTQ